MYSWKQKLEFETKLVNYGKGKVELLNGSKVLCFTNYEQLFLPWETIKGIKNKIEALIFTNCNRIVFPDDISIMEKVNYIIFDSSNIEGISKAISTLPSLEVLIILYPKNKNVIIPNNINLKHISIRGRMKKIGIAATTMNNLINLSIVGANFEFPMDIYNLEKLENLEISSTNTYIPDGIGKLHNLRYLSISGGLVDLKIESGDLSSLQKVKLSGTKIPRKKVEEIIDRLGDRNPKIKIL